jgi:hypothetical protein
MIVKESNFGIGGSWQDAGEYQFKPAEMNIFQ